MDMNNYQSLPLSKIMFRPEKPEDWEPYRQTITELYATMTLPQVMAQMEAVYAFSGTPKQYKTKFRDWGLTTKYVKKDEYEDLLTQEEREEYNVRGKRVTSQDLARFRRRQEKISQKKDKEGGSSGKRRSRKDQPAGQEISQDDAAAFFTAYDDNAGEGPSNSAEGFMALADVAAAETYFDYSGADATVGGIGYITAPETTFAYGYDPQGALYDQQSVVAYQAPGPQQQPGSDVNPGAFGGYADPNQPGAGGQGQGGWTY